MDFSPKLISSLDLVHRVSRAAAAYTLARMGVLERLPGNPVGVAIRRNANVVALMARHLPSTTFNCVIGLRPGQEDQIRPLVEWYREHGIAGVFEIAAGDDHPALARELTRLGYFRAGCHAGLIGAPDSSSSAPGEAPVERVAPGERMDEFLTAYVAGWALPEAARDEFKRNARAWPEQPGWTLYLARVDGRPAAAAILFIQDGVGYFADCAVDPAFRGRGLHRALLRRRLRDASAARIDFVCAGATFLSTSQRNMERMGMRLLFLRAMWTPVD